MRQPRSVTMDNGAQRWHATPHRQAIVKIFHHMPLQNISILKYFKIFHRQAIVKIFHHMPLPHIVIWPTAIKTTRGRPSWPLWKQCTQFQQTNISLNPQLENIPTRSTIAAWSSLLMLLNANPPCLLRGQSKYFGKCQDAVECHAYMPMARHSAICYIPHTNVYPCIPMYTNVYSVISRIPHNYWPECQQGHCLHPLLVWQWLIQKGCVFMQMCIEHMNIYDGSKKISSAHLWTLSSAYFE